MSPKIQAEEFKSLIVTLPGKYWKRIFDGLTINLKKKSSKSYEKSCKTIPERHASSLRK